MRPKALHNLAHNAFAWPRMMQAQSLNPLVACAYDLFRARLATLHKAELRR